MRRVVGSGGDYESETESEHGEGAERGHGPGTAEEREGEPRGA